MPQRSDNPGNDKICHVAASISCKFITTSGKMVTMGLTADTISNEPSTDRIKHYSLYFKKKKKNYGRARVNKVDEDFFRSSPGKQ